MTSLSLASVSDYLCIANTILQYNGVSIYVAINLCKYMYIYGACGHICRELDLVM